MKKYVITNRTVKEVAALASENLKTDHYVGGFDNAVEVMVDDSETYFDSLGYESEPVNMEATENV
jgi:hypothetical protein